MTKFFNMFKKPCFWPIFGEKFFSRKSGSVTHNINGFLALCQNFEKTNDTILRKCLDRWKHGWKDRKTDRPYFIGPFQLTPGVQKNSRDKEQITQSFQPCTLLKEVLPNSRSHLRVKLHLYFSVWGIWKFRDPESKSTKQAARKTKNILKCSTSHLASNKVYLECKEPFHDPVVLVFH